MVKLGCLTLLALFGLLIGAGLWHNRKMESDPAYRAKTEREDAERKVASQKADEQRRATSLAAVETVESALKAASEPCEAAWQKVTEATANVRSTGSRLEAYTTAGEAKLACDDAFVAFNFDVPKKIPEDLPKEVKKALREASTSMGLASRLRREAMEEYQKYLDSAKASSFAKFKEKTERGRAWVAEAVQHMATAKQKAGS